MGAGYLLSEKVVQSIFTGSYNITLNYLEDESIGMLSDLLDVKVINIKDWLSSNNGHEEEICPSSHVTHPYSTFRLIQQYHRCKQQNN